MILIDQEREKFEDYLEEDARDGGSYGCADGKTERRLRSGYGGL